MKVKLKIAKSEHRYLGRKQCNLAFPDLALTAINYTGFLLCLRVHCTLRMIMII